MDSDTATPITKEIAMLEQYLQDRAIPTDPEFLRQAGIEYVGGNAISTIIGAQFNSNQLGIAIRHPGTDYATVRLVPGGPRCPKDTLPQAYFPHMVDWNKIDGTLVICESALKAITWAMMGYHALSSGGVTTVWMSRKQQWCDGFPHESIESGDIHTVLIAWDSDTEGMNRHVSEAMRSICRALAQRYPKLSVKIHVMPPPPEKLGLEKWGCDDMHKFMGSEDFANFCQDVKQRRDPEIDPLQQHFDELSEKYVVCEAPPKVINLRNGAMHNMHDFNGLIECRRQITVDTDKGPKVHQVAPLWIKHDYRPTVEGIRYSPGEDVVAGDSYNMWRPGEVIPRQGDVSPWLDLLTDAVRDPQIRTLMLQCMAYQVQNRGQRLEKLLYFAGRDQGTGKSTMAAIMGSILGIKNSSHPTKGSIEGQFNESWLAKELAILDDIQKLKVDTWSMLKMLITSPTIEVKKKMMPEWEQKNHCVFYITANQADIITTDMDERRVLMIPWEPTILHRDDDDPYWKSFHAWKDNGGLDFIAYYLMHLDLSTFDPSFHPPLTDAKLDAIESAVSDDEVFLDEFKTDPYSIIPRGRFVVTGHELFMLHTGETPNPLNKQDLVKFVKLIKSRMVLDRALEATQFKLMVEDRMAGKKVQVKVALFWVPGCRPDGEQYVLPAAARLNIEKYELGLQES
jgi:hypothetical protein